MLKILITAAVLTAVAPGQRPIAVADGEDVAQTVDEGKPAVVLMQVPDRQQPYMLSQNEAGRLIPKYVAARAAQKVVPGKLLDVRLSRRGAPVYLVKLRDRARIRVVTVDARTGQVLGY